MEKEQLTNQSSANIDIIQKSNEMRLSKAKTVSFILIAIIGIAGVYTIITQNIIGQLIVLYRSTDIAEPAVATPTPQIAIKWISFTHPVIGYTIKYPSEWHMEEYDTKKDDPQITKIIFSSPDFETASPYESVETGAEIHIYTHPTDQTIVEDELQINHYLLYVVAENVTDVTIADESGIQFDWGYETHNGTTTMFIKNGITYQIFYRYRHDNASKRQYWEEYQYILDTFKT